ncbi:MAG: hypothetical protein JRH00_04245 [Deltaproteobacteria bacterium]|nr:hypothetical protein [Deltaproteobacteria bacterium]
MAGILSEDGRQLLQLVLRVGKQLNDEDFLARTLSEFGSDPMRAIKMLNEEFRKLERRQPTGRGPAVKSFRDVSDESFLGSLGSPSQFNVSDDRRGHPPSTPEIEKPVKRSLKNVSDEALWNTLQGNPSYL